MTIREAYNQAERIRRAVAFGLLLCAVLLPARTWAFPLLAQGWGELSPRQRYDALQNYRRHEQLPQERQRDVERRYRQWQQLSPGERDRVRQNYDRLRRMPPQERERFERKYQKWRRQNPPPPPP